jgi:thiamine pyrophosphokinase
MLRNKYIKGIIVCNGQLSKKVLNEIKDSQNNAIIISADGASNKLAKFNLIPHYIVGDFDSISKDSIEFFKKKGVTFLAIKEQEHNDLEKCLKLCMELKIKDIIVYGATGKRLDHTLNNLSILKRYYKKAKIRFIDNENEIFVTDKDISFDYRKGDVISIFGYPKAEGIITEGLKYPLKNETLELGKREGALNKASDDRVRIRLGKCEILVVRKRRKELIPPMELCSAES